MIQPLNKRNVLPIDICAKNSTAMDSIKKTTVGTTNPCTIIKLELYGKNNPYLAHPRHLHL